MDEETERLLHRAKQLVNNEFRNFQLSDDGKENDIPCSQTPLPQRNHVKPYAQSVRDARLKIRQEWEALKNSTISPVNESITEKVKEVRMREYQNDILFGVVAYIEINGNEKQVATLKYTLKSLGATVKDNFAMEVTHVVFQNGSLKTFKRAKLLNVHLVSLTWVTACKNSKSKVCERLFPVVDKNDYSNSPRVFRRFMEYQSKFYEYDETSGGIIRKSSKNQQSNLVSSLENLNIGNETRRETSEESLTLRLSEPENSDTSLNTSNYNQQLSGDPVEIPTSNSNEHSNEYNFDKDKSDGQSDTAMLKRKLLTIRALKESFSNLSQNIPASSQKAIDKPPLINPYGKNLKNKTPKKKKLPNQNRPKVSNSKSPPKKQGSCAKNLLQADGDVCHGILNFHDVYKRTHQMFRPPSKYNHTDHGQCPSLVSTSLHATQNKHLKEVVTRLGGFHFKAKVDRTTTHIVCGGPFRTINLLKAIARGCWVLNLSWVTESEQAGRWLGEEQHELTEFSKIVQRSRIQKQTFGDHYSLDIFDDIGSIYVSDKSSPPQKDLMELIVLCGGKVTSNPHLAKIIVGEIVSSNNAQSVSEKWVLDCIKFGRYKALKPYFVNNYNTI